MTIWGWAILGLGFAALIAACLRLDRKASRLRERHRRLEARLALVEGDLLRWRKRIAGDEARRRLAQAGQHPTLDLVFRSQYGEDVLLWELFDGALDGTFIEAGAYDGKTLSVTWALEAVGWRGLLVEPIPERAAACRAVRPNAHVVEGALGPEAKGEVTLRIVEGDLDGVDMLSHVEGLVSAEERDHAVDLQRQAGAADGVRSIAVPLTTLNAALEDAQKRFGGALAPVSAIVLDVEGAEDAALSGLDLDRWKPRVLVVEDNTLGREVAASGRLLRAGYAERLRIGVNRVFVRRDDAVLMARAGELAAGVDWPNLTPVYR